MRWIDAARARLRLLFLRQAADARMDEEMRFHVEMEAERLHRAGVPAEDARRQALLTFGGVDRYRDEMRASRGLAWLTGLSLDLRLGFRMVRKYPGLTIVGTLAMVFAVALGAGGFEVIRQVAGPALPFEGGDRLVAIALTDLESGRRRPVAATEYAQLTESLSVLDDVGAFRTAQRNLITASGDVSGLRLAEVTASTFRITATKPVLGRTLLPSDHAGGAAPVAVIGHDVWQSAYGGKDILGTTARIGSDLVTIVGVMPEGYAFPFSHGAWVPLSTGPASTGEVELFGRLAEGATLEQAQAEMAARVERMLTSAGATDERVAVRALPYAFATIGLDAGMLFRAGMYSMNIMFVLFVMLIAVNVAALVFARTATRESEIVVRTALGASRRRILAQLFIEALVLSLIAIPPGLLLATQLVDRVKTMVESSGGVLPFWMQGSLSAGSLLFGCALGLLGAAIAGIAPGLRITGALSNQLRQIGAGGGGMQFGRGAAVAIVGQIAVTVLFVTFAVYMIVRGTQIFALDETFPADAIVSARLAADRASSSDDWTPERTDTDFAAARAELQRRLMQDPRVQAVTFGSRVPGSFHRRHDVEIEADTTPHHIQTAWVAFTFFDALGSRVRSGRMFTEAEQVSGQKVAVVNATFVREILGGRNPVGRRLRYRAERNTPEWTEWHEVIGVVEDLPLTNDPELPHSAGIYYPLEPDAAAAYVAVRMNRAADAAPFTATLRQLVHASDPTMQLAEVMTLTDVARRELPIYRFWMRVMVSASILGMLLALAATYAMMSFAVSRRTREIGIRIALGADRRSIVLATLGRHMLHALTGAVLGIGLLVVAAGGIRSLVAAAFALLFIALTFAVVMIAAVVPIRRILAIQPAQALKLD